jgi:hypothetical protein
MVKSKHKKGLQACPVAAIMLRVTGCHLENFYAGSAREGGKIPSI